MKILSIVIPVFNKSNFTKACLDDLNQLPEDHEIIVINNASTDDTAQLLLKYPRVRVISNDINQGFGRACNAAYKVSQSENVLFLNNDIRVKSRHTDWTNLLLEHCANYIVGPTMGQLDKNFNFVQEANKVLSGFSYMSGWCCASNKNNWDRITNIDNSGPFSEEYFCYFEDTDASFKARLSNINFKVVDIPVVHFGKQTSKQLNTYELYNNARKIFINKWKNQKLK